MALQATTLSDTNFTTIREVIQEYVSNLNDNTQFTVRQILNYIRDKVNRSVTIRSIPVNDCLVQAFYDADGTFERQTIPYSIVRDVFLSLLNSEFKNIKSELDPSGAFKIYTVTAGFNCFISPRSLPSGVTATPAPVVSAPVPVPNSLVEKILDGSVTHVFQVILNGYILALGGKTRFCSKVDAEAAVIDKLAGSLLFSGKELRQEIKSLVRSRRLKFLRKKI